MSSPASTVVLTLSKKKSAVGKYPSLFYTSWGGIWDGSLGFKGTKLWANNKFSGSRFVDFDGTVALGYMLVTESAIKKRFGNEGLNLHSSEIIKIIDPFLKNLSQAFAEQSVGEDYVIVPRGFENYGMASGTKEWT